MTNPVRELHVSPQLIQGRPVVLHEPRNIAIDVAASTASKGSPLVIFNDIFNGHSTRAALGAVRSRVSGFGGGAFQGANSKRHGRKFFEPAEQLPDLSEGKLHRHKQPLGHCDTAVIETRVNGHAFSAMSSGWRV